MESNKDEAERCIEIAEDALRERNYEKAVRLLEKSKRLYPLPKATRLLERIESERSCSGSPSSEDASPSTPSRTSPSGLRRRGGGDASQETTTEIRYTQEQVELVQRVKRSKDYYEILMVTKDSTVEEIKRNYKKIALKMHPDKNHAPGAEEAFKSVNQAFGCLSDPTRRRLYDQGGEQYVQRATSGGGVPHGQYYYTEEMTPEELFEIFLGLRRPPVRRGGHTHVYRQPRPAGVYTTTVNSEFSFRQLIPMLLFLLFAVLFSTTTGPREPSYSSEFQLSATRHYNVKRITQNLGIPYFVKSSFESNPDYQDSEGESLRRFEEYVEKLWLRQTQNQCYQEQRQKAQLDENLKWTFNEAKRRKLQERIDNFQMPHCDMWRRVVNAQRPNPAAA